MRRYWPLALVLALMTLAGCLPSSCQRQASRALFPSDSLSRRVAAQVPADTLRRVWQATGTEAHPLVFPRTVLFGEAGCVYVSDAERNSIFVFSEEGDFVREVRPGAFETPYLIGRRGDTLLVLSPLEARVDFVAGGQRTGSLALPVELPEAPLLWAAAGERFVYVKVLGAEDGGALVQVGPGGEVVARHPLPGPTWRRAGGLRLWGDSLLSLSGFRPVVDVFPRDLAAAASASAALDTMALVGFDSPMLARSRNFMTGEADRPPLLSASAAAVEDKLFVLNMRPGWVQIDVYDRAGRLQHRLVSPDRAVNREFYPRDLAVRRRPDGSYAIAVAFTAPQPMVRLYGIAAFNKRRDGVVQLASPDREGAP